MNFVMNNDSTWLESSRMIQEFVPSWKGLHVDCCKAEDALKDCLHVYHCAENCFLDVNGRLFTRDRVQKVFKINNNCMCIIIYFLVASMISVMAVTL